MWNNYQKNTYPYFKWLRKESRKAQVASCSFNAGHGIIMITARTQIWRLSFFFYIFFSRWTLSKVDIFEGQSTSIWLLAFNSSFILEAFCAYLSSLLWSGSSRFDGFMIYFAIFSFTKIQGRHPVVIKSIPCCCQSSWLKMPSTNSFVLQYILPLYIVTTYRLKLTFPSLSAQFFSFFSLFINNRRYPEEPYSRVFSVITWTTYKNTVNYDRRCSTRVKWCGSICFVYIHATPHIADSNRRQAVSHVSETTPSTDSTFFREMNICGECDLMETTYCFFQPINILHKMPSVQDFLILLVVVLLLMILYFLMEMNRAVQHRIMEHNNEQREVRRPEFIRNMEGRRRRDNENHCVPHNRNRPTENDERQG